MPRPEPKEYLNRFASQLDLSQETRAKAHEICAFTPEKFKARKASFLVAAALIYNASRELEKKVKIRDVAGVLDVEYQAFRRLAKKSERFQNPSRYNYSFTSSRPLLLFSLPYGAKQSKQREPNLSHVPQRTSLAPILSPINFEIQSSLDSESKRTLPEVRG